MFDNRARLTRPHDGDSFWILADSVRYHCCLRKGGHR